LSDPSRYEARILAQRARRDHRLTTNPLNWFSLVGLFKLDEGDNPIGEGGKIQLATLTGGFHARFHLAGRDVRLLDAPGGDVTVNGNPPADRPLRLDVDKSPDLIEAGSLAMRLILRGEKIYLRVWDRASAALKDFNGLKYFPVDAAYRIPARYTLFETPHLSEIWDVLGTRHETVFAGTASFSLRGVACSLLAQEDGDNLLFSFTDETRVDASYPGGRYIECQKPRGNKLTLDFNLAVNWPCAYTDYATCPLPPMENRLPVRVEAGEIRYHS